MLVFVDYEKALGLADCRIDHRYTNLIKYIYKKANAVIRLHQYTADFKMEEEGRQSDVISPKLFTNLLEYTFKRINIENVAININGQLRFADDLVLIANKFDESKEMLTELESSKTVGLNINKTKFMNDRSSLSI